MKTVERRRRNVANVQLDLFQMLSLFFPLPPLLPFSADHEIAASEPRCDVGAAYVRSDDASAQPRTCAERCRVYARKTSPLRLRNLHPMFNAAQLTLLFAVLPQNFTRGAESCVTQLFFCLFVYVQENEEHFM